MIEKLLGANWRTSLSGLITVFAGAVAAKPDLIGFLPDSVEGTVSGVCALIAAVSGGYFALNAKDKKVTGGSVQQTIDGQVAAPGAQTLVDLTMDATAKE